MGNAGSCEEVYFCYSLPNTLFIAATGNFISPNAIYHILANIQVKGVKLVLHHIAGMGDFDEFLEKSMLIVQLGKIQQVLLAQAKSLLPSQSQSDLLPQS